MIIPLVVSGVFLGSVWKSQELKALWKKAILASALSGIFNAAYGLLLSFLNISGNSARANIPANIAANIPTNIPSASNGVSFVVSCGLTGFLAVLVVFFSAVVMIWHRGRKRVESEDDSEDDSEDESRDEPKVESKDESKDKSAE